MIVLAGDVGGTKTQLALYRLADGGRVHLEREATLPSGSYARFDELLQAFLGANAEAPSAAVFGVAGPVIDGAVKLTNLPWEIETGALAEVLRCDGVRLLNDLEAKSYGALYLAEDKLLSLNPGVARAGNRAVIAAGTGLGQALLFWDGARYHPIASEGGHATFAPRNEAEIELLRFLMERHARVSWERVLSGNGLGEILAFLRDARGFPVAPEVAERSRQEDPNAVIGELGVAGRCPTCVEAVSLFLSLYAAQAGNLALSGLALGGVYVGGGIVPKLLPALNKDAFLDSCCASGRFESVLREIPVQIILDPETSLRGAAEIAFELVRGGPSPVGV